MKAPLNQPESELLEMFWDMDYLQVSLDNKESTLKICSSGHSKDLPETLKENIILY